MARKKKAPEAETHANHERWMLSYADMLTLLLALFIVMFAISQVDQKKFEQFSQGMAQYFGEGNKALDGSDGIMDGEPPAPPPDPHVTQKALPAEVADILAQDPSGAAEALKREKAAAAARAQEREEMKRLRDKLQAQLAAQGLKDAVEFTIDERGLIVNIVTDKVLFDVGLADLRPEGLKVLQTIAPIVRVLPNTLTVEGHTDNVPIASAQFPSNWELSTKRATEVLKALVGHGVPMGRISASGYADQRPIASNRTVAGKARNRRVAVVVLPTVPLTPQSSTPAPPVGGSAPAATGAPAPATPGPVTIPTPNGPATTVVLPAPGPAATHASDGSTSSAGH